jgi:acyl carrier protein
LAIEIIFEDESKKNFDNINDAVAFIKNNLPAP